MNIEEMDYVIAQLGGHSALARQMGLSQWAPRAWKGRVPLHRAAQLLSLIREAGVVRPDGSAYSLPVLRPDFPWADVERML